MSQPARSGPQRPPNDHYGRHLLTIVGVLVITAGVAIIWKDSGSGSVTAGISVIAFGVAMTFAAAFYDSADGTLRMRGSEMRFGSAGRRGGAGTNPRASDPDQRRPRPRWWPRWRP
jgi:hypothetical protein